MYIVGVNSSSKKELINKRRKADVKPFSPYIDSDEELSTKTVDIAAAPSLLNVLALQDLESPISREKEAFDHAHSIIGDLEAYRKQMLFGGDTSDIIAALKQKASRARRNTDSKELEEIIKQAELRVAIEAAKKGEV